MRSLFKSPRRTGKVPSYDVPFAAPRVQRIIIPPKPGHMIGKSIAPKRTSSKKASESKKTSESVNESLVLFGAPLETAKTKDTASTDIRYPTSALFPAAPGASSN